MTDYRLITEQIKALAEESNDPIPVMANVSELLFHAMEDVNWAGFYLVKGASLLLGPFVRQRITVRDRGAGPRGRAGHWGARHRQSRVFAL